METVHHQNTRRSRCTIEAGQQSYGGNEMNVSIRDILAAVSQRMEIDPKYHDLLNEAIENNLVDSYLEFYLTDKGKEFYYSKEKEGK